jgi:molybdopterin-guanine dinucleotide biosynthesis protein A
MSLNFAVMAGGESRRFKRDKTVENFEGKPLIQYPVEELSKISENIIVVAKDCSKYEFLGIKCLSDIYDVQCPMVGIVTALKHFNAPVFVVAADTPFVNSEHAKKLLKAVEKYDAVIPVVNGKQHPLYSCYNVTILGIFEKAIAEERFSLMKALAKGNTLFMDEKDLFDSESEKKSFININTIEEYEKALKAYKGE